MAPSRIVALAAEIQTNTQKIDRYLTERGLPPPSFQEDAPLMYKFPPEIAMAQEALSAAIDELWWLNQGAVGTVIARASAISVGLKAIIKFKIHLLVPLGTGTTFQELSDKTGVPLKILTRLLRYAMTDHFFLEPRPGFIKHSLASKALVVIPDMVNWCEMGMYEVGPAKTRIVDAVDEWPTSEEPNNCGFNLANNTNKKMFDFFATHPERANRFKTAMAFLQTFPGLESSYVVQGFDWSSLGAATVIDIGGSHGKVSMDIARAHPNLKLIVQDLPHVVAASKAQLPADLVDRMSFMPHDFFTEQPIKDAAVYYFRWIFHDWSDKYCLRILHALMPALQSGSRVILSERCLEPPCTTTMRQEKWNRESDIVMLATFNSQERDEEDWKQLFTTASPRFTLEQVIRPPGAKLDIIVFRWY